MHGQTGSTLSKIDALIDIVKELKSKRIVIPSKKVRESYTPIVEFRMKKKEIRYILSNRKSKKISTPHSPKDNEV